MTNNNTFVLQEVIDDLVDSTKSLTSPLMKLNYFGRLIKNDELIRFTNNELNGYKNAEIELPDYRKATGNLLVDIQIGWNKHVVPLPVVMIEEKYREPFKY